MTEITTEDREKISKLLDEHYERLVRDTETRPTRDMVKQECDALAVEIGVEGDLDKIQKLNKQIEDIEQRVEKKLVDYVEKTGLDCSSYTLTSLASAVATKKLGGWKKRADLQTKFMGLQAALQVSETTEDVRKVFEDAGILPAS